MPPYRTSSETRKCRLIGLIVAVMLGLAVGLVIGWFAGSHTQQLDEDQTRLLEVSGSFIKDGFEEDTDSKQIRKLLDTIDAEKIKENLRVIVSRPHIAGTEGDMLLAQYIKEQWEKQGLDDVTTVPYEATLSYTSSEEPNKVEIIGAKGEILYQSTLPPLPKGDNWSGYSYQNPYIPYSPSGVVVGDPLFAGYGGTEDYTYLTERNISAAGKIVITRFGGGVGCAQKVAAAEQHGAVGVLIYSEPENTMNGSDTEYPHTWWLPTDGIVLAPASDVIGDLLTQGYPSKSNLHYIPEDYSNLPKIPIQPINAQDAKEILGRMGGITAPSYWIGNLDIAYHIGPKFANPFRPLKLKLSVNNTLKRQTIYNVVGTIRGKIEPDRYVIMGNHRDAWFKGAVDPGTGTAVMLELTRTLGLLKKDGWQPRRSLVFCSWTAEEFGLIGSTEWVEDKILMLEQKAVIYINVDTCVAGDKFSPAVFPTINSAVFKVTNMIPDPVNSSETLYQSWWRNMKETGRVTVADRIKPAPLGLNSDYGAFLYFAGIPGIDISWQNQPSGPLPYPVYHSIYETIYYMEKFLDPNYSRHASCAQFTGLLMQCFADSAVIPFEFGDWVNGIVKSYDDIAEWDETSAVLNISLDPLKESIKSLHASLQTWESHIKTVDRQNPYVLRSLNDHMMLIHRALLNRVPIPNKDLLFRYGIFNNNNELSTIALSEMNEILEQLPAIKKHLTDLSLKIQQLTTLLNRPYEL